jgi:hypothetical protein
LNAGELVGKLRGRRVRLWVGPDGLHVRGYVTAAERGDLKALKAEVLALLSAEREATWQAMRDLGPLIGRPVSAGDRTGGLWGLSPRGAMVDSGRAILTVGLGEVTRCDDEMLIG